MIKKTEIKFILNQGWGDFQELWLMKVELDKHYNGYLVKGDIVWKEVKGGTAYDNLVPFMRVGRWFPMQELIDALTNEKKATEQTETLSELKATKYHLEDMRKLLKLTK